MGKMFVCVMVILSICLTMSGCDVLGRKEPEQSGVTIGSNPLDKNIELTMYTGLRTVRSSKEENDRRCY